MTPPERNPTAKSFDLIYQLSPFNETHPSAWNWIGEPMTELASMHRRINRLRKQHGERMTGWKILLTELDQITGEPTLSVVQTWSATQS